jgi:hypothetical protein
VGATSRQTLSVLSSHTMRRFLSKHNRPALLAFLAGLLGVLFATPYGLFHHSGTADESLVLEGGVRILRGEVPYRDFQLYHTPGAMALAALFFKIFGTHIQVARGLMLLTAFLLCAVVALIGFEIMDSEYGFFSAALVGVACLPAYPIVIYHWIASCCLLLGFYCFLLSRRKGPNWLFVSGLGVGCAALCLQSEGVAGFLAVSLALALGCRRESKRFFRNWLVFLGGIGALWLPFAVSLFALKSQEAFWQQAVMRAVSRIHKLHAYPYNFAEFALEPWRSELTWYQAILALPETFRYATLLPVLGAAVVVGFYKGGVHRDFALLVLVWFLLKKERLDSTYANFLTPLWSISVVWLVTLVKGNPRRLLVALLGLVFLSNALALVSEPWREKHYFQTHRGSMWVREKAERDDLQTVYDRALELSPPGREAFSWPFSPQFHFLSATRNPTRFDHLVAGWHDRQQCQNVRAVLSETTTEYLYHWPLSEQMVNGFPNLDPNQFQVDLKEQKALVVGDYERLEDLGTCEIYKRR